MMTVDEYQRWKDDPLTVKFHAFLRDYRASLMEQWAAGALQGEGMMLAMGRCQLALDLVDLDDDFISGFYRQPPKEESDDSK